MYGVKIIIILLLVLFLLNLLKKFKRETFLDKPKILLLMRSYNRPEYLLPTLQSLDESDINLCHHKIIYDDASQDSETLKILDDYESKYKILRNKKNYKQQSMVKLLEYVEKSGLDFEYICYLDNDALVKSDFIQKCMETYQLIKKEQQIDSNKIILTGFNTEQNNHKVLKDYGKYKLKNHIGGIHMFFDKVLLSDVKKWWSQDLDWGIVNEFTKVGGKFFCTSPSIVQHTGKIGYNSHGEGYDKSSDF